MKFILIAILTIFLYQYSMGTPIPIANPFFETELVRWGYDSDGSVNGQMDDSDISSITILSLPNATNLSGNVDLTQFINLINLSINDAPLSEIRFGHQAGLASISLNNTPNISTIDFSNVSNLTGFNFNQTGLTSLNLLKFTNINSCRIINNPNLTSLKINSAASPAGNIPIDFGTNNTLLNCVEVNDVTLALTKVANGEWVTGGKTLSLSCNPTVEVTFIDPNYISLPQLTNVNIATIPNPQPGMMTWSTDDNCVKVYNGTAWNCL